MPVMNTEKKANYLISNGVDLDMCLSVNIKLINTHPRVPIPYLWDRPSRKKSDLVFVGGLS